jgi:hypothetical protein
MIARMVKVTWATLGLLLVVGAASCGSGSGGGLNPDERAVQGTWAFELSAYEALGLTFNGLEYESDHIGLEYESDHIAVLTDGTTALEAELGTFSTSGNSITFVPEQWSCRGSDPPLTLTFGVNATTFTLVDQTGALLFQKITPSGGSGAVTFGCFDNASMTFTPSPIAPVP